MVAVTAARGRGKSAALGLAVAEALSPALRRRNVWVASASPEAVGTLFDFAERGLARLGFVVKREQQPPRLCATGADGVRRTVRFLSPLPQRDRLEFGQLHACDLLCIDEAAAIPLPLVRAMIEAAQDCPVFLASTVNGYEGTGRSLSLKVKFFLLPSRILRLYVSLLINVIGSSK